MRKLNLILSTALFAVSVPGFAQDAPTTPSVGLKYPTQKGHFMVGANLNFGELGFGDLGQAHIVGTYNVGIAPRAGYFITDNFMVGGSFSADFYGDNTTRYAPYRSNSHALGAGVFARKYFGKPSFKNGELKRWRFFAEAGASYQRSRETYMVEQGRQETFVASTGKFSVTPGVSYFISKNVALEAGLTYSRTINSDFFLEPQSQLRFHVGLQIFLGR